MVVVLFLLLHASRRPDGLVALHSREALLVLVYLQQVVQRGDLGQRAACRVGRVLHAQLVEDLLLDGLQTEVPQALPEQTGLAARSRRRHIVFRFVELVGHPVPPPGHRSPDAGSIREQGRRDGGVTASRSEARARAPTQDDHCHHDNRTRKLTTVDGSPTTPRPVFFLAAESHVVPRHFRMESFSQRCHADWPTERHTTADDRARLGRVNLVEGRSGWHGEGMTTAATFNCVRKVIRYVLGGLQQLVCARG